RPAPARSRGTAVRCLLAAGLVEAPVAAVDPVQIGFQDGGGLLVLDPTFPQQLEDFCFAHLAEPAALETAFQHRSIKHATVVVEFHPKKTGLDSRALARAGSTEVPKKLTGGPPAQECRKQES